MNITQDVVLDSNMTRLHHSWRCIILRKSTQGIWNCLTTSNVSLSTCNRHLTPLYDGQHFVLHIPKRVRI